jgi:hypothetical protein
MIQKPRIPMTPEEVPQQRLSLVVDLPARPPQFQGYCEYVNPMPGNVAPKGSPRKLTYIGSVEWATSPRDCRLDSYYLNPRGSYWLLWNWYQDENDWDFAYRWVLYGYARKVGADARTAATYLLLDAWKSERDSLDLGPYFLIDEACLLSVSEIKEIGSAVWAVPAGNK